MLDLLRDRHTETRFVKSLTNYLKPRTLQKLQDAFCAACGLAIRIFDAGGEPLTKRSDPPEAPADKAAGPDCAAAARSAPSEVPVLVNRQIIGRVRYCADEGAASDRPAANESALSMLRLTANVLGRLCDREKELRARVDELATLYHLTAEFTGQRDLQAVLDMVADTVVQVLHAKGCSIRLLSEDRTELMMKAVADLSPEYLDKGPILVSRNPIDQEVLSSGKPVYVADQRTDPRVSYAAEARREGLVSALCAPLVYHGRAEGVLRVYMAEVHEFDWFEVSLLEAISGQAAAAIVNARLYEEAVRAGTIRRHLRLARQVQQQMIPDQAPHIVGFDIGAIYVPCFELGGDFYDFIDLPPGNLGVTVCDVVGKGLRASLLMASIRASLRAHAVNVYDMSNVLGNVNRDLCADTLVSDFATMFYGVIDVPSRRLTYANAGHTPPLLVRGGACRSLRTGGSVLGIDPGLTWPHEAVPLAGGDVVLVYTDGLSDAMNFDDEPFGRPRIEQALLEAVQRGDSAEAIVKHVLWEMRRFAGLQERFDDLTMVAVRVL